jgi:chromosome segregation ATPase
MLKGNMYSFVIYILLISGVLNAENSKRLLLNDPSVLADRLTKLESKIQQLMSGKQQQDATIQQLKSGKQQQDATIQQLQATLNQHGKFT